MERLGLPSIGAPVLFVSKDWRYGSVVIDEPEGIRVERVSADGIADLPYVAPDGTITRTYPTLEAATSRAAHYVRVNDLPMATGSGQRLL